MNLPGQFMALLDVARFLVSIPQPDPTTLGGFAGPWPVRQFFNAKGKMLSGGLLWTYIAGTTTPLAVSSTSDMTLAATNPIVLDAYGRTTYYISPAVSYKFVLQTAGGYPVASQDNVAVSWFDTSIVPVDFPTGGLAPYVGTTAPDGFLMADGRFYPVTMYPALYAIVGNLYADGVGLSGHFRVPNLTGRFPLGQATSGTGAVLGESGGEIDHTHAITDHLHAGPSHTHAITVPGSGAGGGGSTLAVAAVYTSVAGGTGDTPLAALAPATNNPPFMSLSWVLKY